MLTAGIQNYSAFVRLLIHLVNELRLVLNEVHRARVHGRHQEECKDLANEASEGSKALDLLHEFRCIAIADCNELLVVLHALI